MLPLVCRCLNGTKMVTDAAALNVFLPPFGASVYGWNAQSRSSSVQRNTAGVRVRAINNHTNRRSSLKMFFPYLFLSAEANIDRACYLRHSKDAICVDFFRNIHIHVSYPFRFDRSISPKNRVPKIVNYMRFLHH